MYKPIRKADLIIGGTTIKQGEIFTLGFQLFDAEGLVIVPTVEQTISVKVANKTGVVFETTAVVVSDHIEFTVDENIGSGKMRVELTVADGVNVLQKYPANGYIELNITASLDDIGSGFIYTVTAAEMFTRIEGSEEASASAVQTAGEAVVIAESAVETADAVRADFDLVVAEAGSSNPEVVLARGEFATLEGRLDDANQQLADTAISPERYQGTDVEKVQQAINDAIAQNKSVRFSKIYDITGSILIINKPTNDRTILYLTGQGGGIKKTDAGFIFTTTNLYAGDVISRGMKYSSVHGAGTQAWNAKGIGGIIRFSSVFDSYVNVDTVIEATGSFIQSVRLLKCTITGGLGWAGQWDRSYDSSFTDCTIEHRDSGFRNTAFIGNPDNDNLRLINNVIEGLSGKGLELGSSFAVIIQGNYMEANVGGYFDLSKSLNFHNGLTLISNSVQQDQTQIDTDVAAIKLGNMGNNGVTSNGNASTGVLYELVDAGTPGRLSSTGDISYNNKKAIGYTTGLIELGKKTITANGSSYGGVGNFFNSSPATLFAAGEVKSIEINFAGIADLVAGDFVTISSALGSGNQNLIVRNWVIDTFYDKVIVNVKNESTGSQNITVTASVMQIK